MRLSFPSNHHGLGEAMNIKVGVAVVGVAVSLTACMSAEQKHTKALNQTQLVCYGAGFKPGTQQYNQCLALGYVHFTQQIERDEAANRERIGDALIGAGAAMQSAGRSNAISCTTTGPYQHRSTTCW